MIREKYETESWFSYFWNHIAWVLCRREITFWWQRRTRGFDDSELWSLDQTIIEFVLPRLKAFRAKEPHGFPLDMYGVVESRALGEGKELSKEINDRAYHKWLSCLDKMIRAFELQLDDDMFLKKDENGEVVYEGEEINFWGGKGHPVQDPALRAEFEEGWALFKEHFFSLWD